MANEGIPSSVIGVPGRYIHTHQTLSASLTLMLREKMVIQVLKGWINQQLPTIVEGK